MLSRDVAVLTELWCSPMSTDFCCPPRYEDWMKMFLRSCGPRCAKVRMLPVFDLTQVTS